MAKKQLEIAGTERKSVKEIDDAAEAYVEQRDKRMKLSKKEKEAKNALIEVMHRHKVKTYKVEADTPLLVVLTTGTDQVKVSEFGEGDEDSDEDDSEEEAGHTVVEPNPGEVPIGDDMSEPGAH